MPFPIFSRVSCMVWGCQVMGVPYNSKWNKIISQGANHYPNQDSNQCLSSLYTQHHVIPLLYLPLMKRGKLHIFMDLLPINSSGWKLSQWLFCLNTPRKPDIENSHHLTVLSVPAVPLPYLGTWSWDVAEALPQSYNSPRFSIAQN